MICGNCKAKLNLDTYVYCPWCGIKIKRKEVEKIPCPDCGELMTYISHVFWYCDKCKKMKG